MKMDGKKDKEVGAFGSHWWSWPGGLWCSGALPVHPVQTSSSTLRCAQLPKEQSSGSFIFISNLLFPKLIKKLPFFFFLLNAFTVQSTPLFWFFCWFFSHCFKLDQLAVQSFQLLWAPCVGRAVSSLHGFLYYPSLSVLTN